MRTLILSDLHLGSRACQATPLIELLDREPYDQLILNGDTLNSVNLRKLAPVHWAILERLRRLARARRLILVRGNHDHEGDYRPHANGQDADRPRATQHTNGNGDSANGDLPPLGSNHILPALLDAPMVEECRVQSGEREYAVLHGDRFDPSLNVSIVNELAAWGYHMTHKLSKKLAKWLKKKSKRWTGVLQLMRHRSLVYARERNLAGIITGHTHFAEDAYVDGLHYVNSGCWTEPPCTYVSAGPAGVTLHHVPE